MMEKDITYQLMAEINEDQNQVRIQILGKEKMLSLNKVISLVTTEESRREVMLKARAADNLAMATCLQITSIREEPSNNKNLGENKDNLWCTFSKKSRHTKEKCRKLHGNPLPQAKN